MASPPNKRGNTAFVYVIHRLFTAVLKEAMSQECIYCAAPAGRICQGPSPVCSVRSMAAARMMMGWFNDRYR